MSKCKKCGNKLLTVSSYVSNWDADQEPYESGVHEEHEGICESVYLSAEYCEKCEAFDGIYLEAAMIEEKDLEAENAALNKTIDEWMGRDLSELKAMQKRLTHQTEMRLRQEAKIKEAIKMFNEVTKATEQG